MAGSRSRLVVSWLCRHSFLLRRIPSQKPCLAAQYILSISEWLLNQGFPASLEKAFPASCSLQLIFQEFESRLFHLDVLDVCSSVEYRCARQSALRSVDADNAST